MTDERDHEFWVAVERRGDAALFACGDVLNLTRAHGDTVRDALERQLATLEARARSLRAILIGAAPEEAQTQLEQRGPLRAAQLVLRPRTSGELLATIVGVPGE